MMATVGPRLIRRDDIHVMGEVVDVVRSIDSLGEALASAAQTGRIAQLMLKGLNQPDVEEAGDFDLLHRVVSASQVYMERAIELHNAQVPTPEDQPGVTPLRQRGGA